MTIQQVIDAILNYHPELSQDKPTCDGFKCGNPSDECRGIVTTCAASMEVIRKAIELGANLILVHEPTFYTHMDPVDWLAGDPVYEQKRGLLDEHGIAVWRDHDHIHAHRPDRSLPASWQSWDGWTTWKAMDSRAACTCPNRLQ